MSTAVRKTKHALKSHPGNPLTAACRLYGQGCRNPILLEHCSDIIRVLDCRHHPCVDRCALDHHRERLQTTGRRA